MTGRTPLARVGDPGPWRFEGACVSADDPSLWFAGADEPGQTVATIRKQREAVEICRGCPVLAECRDHALRTNELFGVWGGLSPSQRKRMRAQRRATR